MTTEDTRQYYSLFDEINDENKIKLILLHCEHFNILTLGLNDDLIRAQINEIVGRIPPTTKKCI